MSYRSYWWLRQQLDRCELFPSADDQLLCKADVLSRYERGGMRGYYQDRRTQAQIQAQAAAQRAATTSNTLIIAALVVAGAFLLGRK